MGLFAVAQWLSLARSFTVTHIAPVNPAVLNGECKATPVVVFPCVNVMRLKTACTQTFNRPWRTFYPSYFMGPSWARLLFTSFLKRLHELMWVGHIRTSDRVKIVSSPFLGRKTMAKPAGDAWLEVSYPGRCIMFMLRTSCMVSEVATYWIYICSC